MTDPIDPKAVECEQVLWQPILTKEARVGIISRYLKAAREDYMLRSVAAMAIAEGEKGWREKLTIDCPMLHAVAELRNKFEALPQINILECAAKAAESLKEGKWLDMCDPDEIRIVINIICSAFGVGKDECEERLHQWLLEEGSLFQSNAEKVSASTGFKAAWKLAKGQK